jgi:hypothetical protein
MTLWRWIIWFLTWLSADPADYPREAAKAAAAVSAARASMAVGEPSPAPTPAPGGCCGECGGRGYIIHGDGHRTACPCPPSCKCKAPKPGATCPDGKCPVPAAPPMAKSPARPAGGR